MNTNLFIELTGMFFIPLLTVLLSILIGQWYGTYHLRKSANIQAAPVGSVVGAAFALLAFMLAFTFQITSNRFDRRKELLLEEVTNIRTTYLQAGLIPEPFRSGCQKLLVEYVDLRVDVVKDISKLDHTLSRSQQILDTCWKYAESIAEQDRGSDIYALYIASVNDLVDDYNQRITITFQYHIPGTVLWVLFIITFLSMFALGYHFGISGKGHFGINLLFAIIFAMVMFLILVLDHPETGMTQLNQEPLFVLQQQLKGKM